MKRYHTPIEFSATATDAATNYPATNVENQYIDQPWRTPDTNGDTLTLTFSSSTPVAVFVIGTNAQHLNFDGTVYPSPTAFSDNREQYSDGVGFVLDTTALQAGTTIEITPSGTPTDGASYYEIGAVYVMEKSADVKTPMWGLDTVMRDPAIIREMPNGPPQKFRTGPRQMLITGQVRPQHADDFEQIFRDDSVQILDLEHSTRTNYVWPVEWKGTEHNRTSEYAADSVQFTLRRVN